MQGTYFQIGLGGDSGLARAGIHHPAGPSSLKEVGPSPISLYEGDEPFPAHHLDAFLAFFTVYRFALALLIAWIVFEAPHYHVPLPIGWPLVGFLLVYDGVLWLTGRFVDFVTHGTLLSLIAMALDTLLAALVLLQFAFPTNTDSPVLLPL